MLLNLSGNQKNAIEREVKKQMSVANQKIVRIAGRKPRDRNNLFATMNLEALQHAMQELKGSSFKLWAYFNKNQDKYQLELSQKACAEWGIKKDSYYSAVKDLTEKGYLVLITPYSNIFDFHEMPLSEIPIYFSENENAASENHIISSEKTQRNNTDITIIKQNKTKEKEKDSVPFYKMLDELERFLNYGMNGYTTEAKAELRELLQKEDLTETDEERIDFLYDKYINF